MGDIFIETTDVAGIPTLPAEYSMGGLTDQLDLATTLSAPQSVSQKVAGRDLELPFYSFAIKVKPDKEHVCRTGGIVGWSHWQVVTGL